jgi:hypothetical protein
VCIYAFQLKVEGLERRVLGFMEHLIGHHKWNIKSSVQRDCLKLRKKKEYLGACYSVTSIKKKFHC